MPDRHHLAPAAAHDTTAPAAVWRCGNLTLSLATPLIMGIVNVTPDSFSDGGAFLDVDAAVAHGLTLVEQGARILDVGGESTRPGSDPVSEADEIARVVPVIEGLAAALSSDPVLAHVAISVDTRHASVAAAAVAAGAHIINDVAGFRDPAMAQVAAETNAGLVAMHMLGEPKTMQAEPEYTAVVSQVCEYLTTRAMELEWMGIARDRIALDPGYGFGKNLDHNLALVTELPRLVATGYPVLVGLSRKTMVGALTGIQRPADRDEASAQLAALLVGLGAQVVRVHNVAATAAEIDRVFGADDRGLAPTTAYVALGSNMGATPERDGRVDHLRHAVDILRATPQTSVVAVSPVVETAAAYLTDQAPFANTVVRLETRLGMVALFAQTQGIERVEGRVRSIANGPRTLDADLLIFGDERSDTAALTVPHPRILERAFVVEPLLQVAPGLHLPNGEPVTADRATVGPVLRHDIARVD